MYETIISHPQNPFGEGELSLGEHLESVAERAVVLNRGSHERPLRTIALLHDFGKVTPQFQAYIRGEYDGPKSAKQHARIGAFVTFYALKVLDCTPLDSLAGALAVARHHGVLPDAAPYTATRLKDAFDDGVLYEQVERINETSPDTADEFIASATDGAGSWQDFLEAFTSNQVMDELHSMSTTSTLAGPQINEEALPNRLYDRMLHYWGTLTFADKSHAGGFAEGDILDYETLCREPLDRHVKSLQESEVPPLETRLNGLREDARQQVIRGVHDWAADTDAPPIATLRLPTGLGKTFTGVSGALSLADALPETHPPRSVVYALPFTSIIEQTRELFEDNAIWGADPTGRAFTIHHHLSETVTYGRENDEKDEIEFLGESWRSGVVLTTFVQLFESLAGPSKTQGLKLSALNDAILILDEPQALPKDWWEAMPRFLELLTEEYGAQIISMTATQPSLFSFVDTTDLLERGAVHTCGDCPTERPTHTTAEYFKSAQRVTYRFDESVFAHRRDGPEGFIGHEAAANRVLNRAREDSSSVLTVCNTIASSRAMTTQLKEHEHSTTHLGSHLEAVLTQTNQSVKLLEADAVAHAVLNRCGVDTSGEVPTFDSDTALIATFNSRFRPFDRRVLIELADTLSTAGIPFVFISTQAVEAGVDLSFKSVYRDIAPVDSIVQAAGRCNRSFEWGERGGEVTVWTLAGVDEPTPDTPSEPAPAKYIYEQAVPGHLQLIADTLHEIDDRSGVPDSAVADHAVRTYFEALARKNVGETSIRGEIESCRGVALGKRSLIGDYETVDVVVGVSEVDIAEINAVGELFQPEPTRDAFEAVDDLSLVRVSLPIDDVESALTVPRLDRRTRDSEEGVQVYQFTGEAGLSYELDDGGLVGTDDDLTGRFTVL